MGELTLTALDEDVLARLGSRAAAILRAEIPRLSATPKVSEEQWLVMAEEARRQWKPLDVSVVDLIREGRDEH